MTQAMAKGGNSMSLANNKIRELKNRFSKIFRDSLKERYGKLPSANCVARDFNLIAYDINPVTQETVRRWMRGISMPEDVKLKVLANWLHLDLNSIFNIPTSEKQSFKVPKEWHSLSERDYKLILVIANRLLNHIHL